MLAQSRRRWANIEPELGGCHVFAGGGGGVNDMRRFMLHNISSRRKRIGVITNKHGFSYQI